MESLSSVKSWFSCFNCCNNQGESEGHETKQLDSSANTSRSKSGGCFTWLSNFNFSCNEVNQHRAATTKSSKFLKNLELFVPISISGAILCATSDLRNSFVEARAPICQRLIICTLSSAVAFCSIPLIAIEGIARRAIGWTLSLLDHVLPCGNKTFKELNNNYFFSAFRNHLNLSFTAFEHTFGIFEPNTILRSMEAINIDSLILSTLSATVTTET